VRTQAEPDKLVVPEAGTEPGQQEAERLKLKKEYEKELRELQEDFEEEQQELEEELQEMDESEWNKQIPQWLEGEDMQMWQDKIKEWTDSKEFKQWQEQMKRWEKQMKQWAKGIGKMGKAERNTGRVKIKPIPKPMPVMPQMPNMPVPIVPKIEIDLPVIVETPSEAAAPNNNSQTSPFQLNATQTPQDIEVNKSENGMYVATAQMHFFTTITPNASFVVRNNIGNITLSQSKDDNCTARAFIRAKAETAAEAQQMIEQVSISCHSSGDSCYLGVVKPGDKNWKNLNVDFDIKVPSDVCLDVKTNMGSIELFNLKGKIKTVTNMGSIKVVETCGDLELTTNMGDIHFTAPRNISAKFKVNTNMGTIESELPLDIDTSDMMKRKAQGIVSGGQDSISLRTNMGKVNIKWQSSP
jgi:hypothetical protein